MKDSFSKTGDFFETSGVPRVEPFTLKRRIYSLCNMVVWFTATVFPMMFYLIRLLISGQILYFSIGAVIISACKYIAIINTSFFYFLFHLLAQ